MKRFSLYDIDDIYERVSMETGIEARPGKLDQLKPFFEAVEAEYSGAELSAAKEHMIWRITKNAESMLEFWKFSSSTNKEFRGKVPEYQNMIQELEAMRKQYEMLH